MAFEHKCTESAPGILSGEKAPHSLATCELLPRIGAGLSVGLLGGAVSSVSHNLPGDREPLFRGRRALLHLYAPGVPSCGQDCAVFICVVQTACGIFKEFHEKQVSTLSRVPNSVTKGGGGDGGTH